VLWVIKGLGPGGAERLLVDHAATTEGGVDYECVYVLSWKTHLRADLEALGVRCRPAGRFRGDPLWPIRLMWLVHRSKADVVHVHSPLPGFFARLANPRSRPVVSTQHNRWQTFRWFTRLLAGWRIDCDAAVVCVSEEVRDSLPIVGSEVCVIRHGIDLEAMAAAASDRPRTRRSLGLDETQTVLVTVANYRPQKDYPNLFEAVATSIAGGATFDLLVIGQGPLADDVARWHREHDLADRVTLLGFRADARRIVAACDAMVLASRWEGQPVAVMEALAAGLPVIGTDVGGLREMLGSVATLVPPADSGALAAAITELVHTPRRVPDEASLRAAQTFDARQSTASIERLYRTAVVRSTGGRWR
jgi:glycosyltransferase involved in cell wall biosynthesis